MTGAHSLEKEILKFLGKEDQQLLAITPIGYSAKEPPARAPERPGSPLAGVLEAEVRFSVSGSDSRGTAYRAPLDLARCHAINLTKLKG